MDSFLGFGVFRLPIVEFLPKEMFTIFETLI